MIKNLQEDIYLITIPLPKNPLKELNAYLILGERPLLIDTGFNLDACEIAMRSALDELGVDPNRIDICATHWHNDHVGLIARLATETTKVYSGRIDLGENMQELEAFLDRQEICGMLGVDPNMISQQQEFGARWIREMKFCFLEDGDELTVGNYTLQVVTTPGHFANHICLYEPKHKFLFGGDHILDRITPNIASFHIGTNELETYLFHLAKVKKMDVDLIYPGHRNIITNHKKRIEELVEHHQNRLEEIKTIVKGRAKTPMEVAAKTTWHVSNKSWYSFPFVQKVFSLAETLAHLNYLLDLGVLKTTIINNQYHFRL